MMAAMIEPQQSDNALDRESAGEYRRSPTTQSWQLQALPKLCGYRRVNICTSVVKNRNYFTTISSLLHQGPLPIINSRHSSSAVSSCTVQLSCCLTGIWCLFSRHLGTRDRRDSKGWLDVA